MIPPTSIDGTDITGATIDGTDVQEITVDGDVVFTAGPQIIPDDSVEGFEDGSLSEYQGAVSFYQIQTQTVFKGSRALETVSDFDNMFRTDIGSPGDEISIYVRGSDANFNFGYDGFGYRVLHQTSSDEFSFGTDQNGTYSNLVSQTAVLNSSEWYQYVIDYNPGNITIQLFDTTGNLLGTINSNDSSFSNTGIGFRGRVGTFYDAIDIN